MSIAFFWDSWVGTSLELSSFGFLCASALIIWLWKRFFRNWILEPFGSFSALLEGYQDDGGRRDGSFSKIEQWKNTYPHSRAQGSTRSSLQIPHLKCSEISSGFL